MAVVAATALSLAACDALLGLDQYHDVACAFEASCPPDARESGGFGHLDATSEAPPGFDAGPDADGGAGDADADTGSVVTPDAGWPMPTGHEIWAHWPMPNPDAAIGPDSSTALPHPMTYDAGADGGATVAYDIETGLSWTRTAAPATTYDLAWKACGVVGATWRLPTRIELVSLVDFTRAAGPTIDPTTFPSVATARTWTSSPVAGEDAATSYWVVDFTNGLTAPGGGASQVLCVNGGTP